MENNKVFAMSFRKVYSCLLAKLIRKGRTEEDLVTVVTWLTGYSPEQVKSILDEDTAYGSFFENAPAYNPLSEKITGKICGITVETIEDPLMKKIRQLDKLVDELAKGKPIEKVLRG